jgi:hypothetical protein
MYVYRTLCKPFIVRQPCSISFYLIKKKDFDLEIVILCSTSSITHTFCLTKPVKSWLDINFQKSLETAENTESGLHFMRS